MPIEDPELTIKLLDNTNFKPQEVKREDVGMGDAVIFFISFIYFICIYLIYYLLEGVQGALLLHNVLSSEECNEIVEQVYSTGLENPTPVLWRQWYIIIITYTSSLITHLYHHHLSHHRHIRNLSSLHHHTICYYWLMMH